LPQRGHYESWYLRAVDPARPRAIWIRQTSFTRPGEAPTTAAWCTVFEEGRPWAVKQSGPEPTGAVGPALARGSATAGGRHAAWELSIASAAPALRHLARPWMYRTPLPRTKLESPQPDAVLSGWVEGDGRRMEVAGWPGMTGHNWGAEHAAQWVWLHGTAFADVPGAWLDVALGRVRVGGVLTPWVANGAVGLDGERIRVGGLGRRARVRAVPGEIELAVGRIRVRADAPLERTVAFAYADPAGGARDALNCSLARLRVRVERPGRRPVELATAHGGVYELGGPAGTSPIPLEPFPDP
jgi:hypothetical protein